MHKQIMDTILAKIKEYDTIMIFRHFRPDGDAIGSTKGLWTILKDTYPEKEIYLLNEDSSQYLEFLGGESEPIADELYADALCIVLDTGTADRISNKKYSLCRELIKIDHHIDISPYGDISWVEDERSSACEMIVAFYAAFRDQLKISRHGATCLYTGMITDIIFGSLATLLAAIGTYLLRKKPILAAACPVLVNAVIVGLVLALTSNWPIPLTMLQVGLGETGAVLVGFVILSALKRAKVDLTRLG